MSTARSRFAPIKSFFLLAFFFSTSISGLALIAAGHFFIGPVVAFALVEMAMIYALCRYSGEVVQSLHDIRVSNSERKVCGELVHDEFGCRFRREPVYGFIPGMFSLQLITRTRRRRFRVSWFTPPTLQFARAERLLRGAGIPEVVFDPARLIDAIVSWGRHERCRRLLYDSGLLNPRLDLVNAERMPPAASPEPLRELAELAWIRTPGDRNVVLMLTPAFAGPQLGCRDNHQASAAT